MQITENPLVRRVVDVFDTNGDGELDFQEFLNGLAQVANKADRRQKLAFAFRCGKSFLIETVLAVVED